jgi:hypothetical protein
LKSDIEAQVAPAVGIIDGKIRLFEGPSPGQGPPGFRPAATPAAAPPLRSADCNSPATADCKSSRANSSPHVRISGLVLDFRDDHTPLEARKLWKLVDYGVVSEMPDTVEMEPEVVRG